MEKEHSSQEDKNTRQALSDSNIKPVGLSRFGVDKPYTVFVGIIVVAILGIFAFINLATELFPNINVPIMVVSSSRNMQSQPSQNILRAARERAIDDWYKDVWDDTTADERQNEIRQMSVVIRAQMVEGTHPPYGSHRAPDGWSEPDWWNIYPNNDSFGNMDESHYVLREALLRVAVGQNVQLATADLLTSTDAYVQHLTDSIRAVEGVSSVQSTSNPMGSAIIVEFASGVDTRFAQNDLQAALSLQQIATQEYGFNNPLPMRFDPNMMPVVQFSAAYQVGDALDQEANIGWLNDVLISRLQSLSGVASINNSAQVNQNGQLEDPYSFTLIDGVPYFSFGIQMASQAVITQVAASVVETLSGLSYETGGNFRYTVTTNQGTVINESIGGIVTNVLIGGALAIAIIFIFLRSLKLTLAVALSIPLSVVATFVLMFFMDISLNMVSMAGLALAVGLIVDNSIIVLENIYRLRQKGLSNREAAIKGASQIFGAILAATLTTVAVFVPMFFVTGIIMEAFMDMVWVVIFAMLASFFAAIMFVPSVVKSLRLECQAVRKWDKGHYQYEDRAHDGTLVSPNWAIRLSRKVDDKLNIVKQPFAKAYDRALGWTIKNVWHKLAVVGLAVTVFVVTIVVVVSQGNFEMMPAVDNGQFNIQINLRRGAVSAEPDNGRGIAQSLSEGTDTGALQGPGIVALLQQDLGSDMDFVAAVFNSGQVMGMTQQGPRLSFMVTMSANRSTATASAAQRAHQIVTTYLQDRHLLDSSQGSNTFASLVSISDNNMGMGETNASITLSGDTSSRVNAALQLLESEVIAEGVQGILNFVHSYDSAVIRRTDRNITETLTFVIADGYNVNQVQTAVNRVVNRLFGEAEHSAVFDNIYRVTAGFAAEMAETMGQMLLAIAAGFVLIYLIMVAIFKSFVMPFIILITVPLAFTGGILTLMMLGMPLSLVSMIGLLILMGIIINNGIVMLDYVNQLREDGLSRDEALMLGVKTRIRPIMMTALSTIFALIPMALATGGQGGMMAPLAIVSIGGLVYAGIMTLFVVPAFYGLFTKNKNRREREGSTNSVESNGG